MYTFNFLLQNLKSVQCYSLFICHSYHCWQNKDKLCPFQRQRNPSFQECNMLFYENYFLIHVSNMILLYGDVSFLNCMGFLTYVCLNMIMYDYLELVQHKYVGNNWSVIRSFTTSLKIVFLRPHRDPPKTKFLIFYMSMTLT